MEYSAEPKRANAVSIVLMLLLAVSLSLPDAYTIAAILVAIIGSFFLFKRLLARAPLLEPRLAGKLCFVFMTYASLCALIQLWHHAPISHYEMYIPFLWSPLIVLAVLDGRIDRRFIWIGCLLGAVFACLLAIYQSAYLGIIRPLGFLGSPITFGNNALLLGCIALAGRHDPPFNLRKLFWFALCYLGFLFGLVASLISQSKGGWPLVPVVLLWVLVEDFWRASPRQRLSFLIVPLFFVCLLPFLQVNKSVDRIRDAAIGTLTWLQTGEIVEFSAGSRLELWKFGLTIWPEKPLLGHGRDGMIQRMHEKIEQNEVNPQIGIYTGLHSESIQLLAEQGLIGLLGWALMFAASVFVFARAYLLDDRILGMLGQAGLITVGASLIFGLSDMNLMLNANRQIFVLLVMVMAALVVTQQKKVDGIPV